MDSGERRRRTRNTGYNRLSSLSSSSSSSSPFENHRARSLYSSESAVGNRRISRVRADASTQSSRKYSPPTNISRTAGTLKNPSQIRTNEENTSNPSHQDSDDSFTAGSCQDMCPSKEREERERLRDLAVFERLNGNPGKTSADLAVKKFCRTTSASTTLPSDIRPLPVLWETLNYLMKFVDNSEHEFGVIHAFLFDRMRAIRQELVIQRIANEQAIVMYERMIRFHILSNHKLMQLDQNKDTSVAYLNLEQLSKCLESLLNLYADVYKGKVLRETQPEFSCYYILLNMGSPGLPSAELLTAWFRNAAPLLFKWEKVKYARDILRQHRLGNFRRFFDLFKGSTYLEACLIECCFHDVRTQAVASINHAGYTREPFPLADLAETLMMTEDDLEGFCRLCDLATIISDKGCKFLPQKQANFRLPSRHYSYFSCPFIDEKLSSTYVSEIMGKEKHIEKQFLS